MQLQPAHLLALADSDFCDTAVAVSATPDLLLPLFVQAVTLRLTGES